MPYWRRVNFGDAPPSAALGRDPLLADTLGIVSFVVAADAKDFLATLDDGSVDLFLIDPPYFRVVRETWDHQWESAEAYAEWLIDLCALAKKKVTARGSLVMFQV